MSSEVESAAFGEGLVFGLFIASVLGIGAVFICHSGWQHAATERGYGQFNQKTGKWEWIEPIKKSEEEPK